MDRHQNNRKRVLASPSSNAYPTVDKPLNFLSTPKAEQHQKQRQVTSTPWSLPKDDNVSPGSKAFTKKAALKRSAGLLNLSIEKDSSNDNDLTANGVTKSFNDLNFDTDLSKDKSEPTTTDRYSPYINRLKRPLTSSSTPISDTSSPFVIPHSSKSNNKQTLNHKLRNASSHESILKHPVESPFSGFDPLSIKMDEDKENLFVAPTKRGSTDGNKSPNDSPSKPLRQKPRYNNSSTVASHIFKSNNRNTSTPIESNKHSFITPSSYKSVKPLQTAFMSSGLLSKKTAKVVPTIKAMPETPCKRPSQHILMDTNTSYNSSSNNTSSLATSVINAADVPSCDNTPTSANRGHSSHSKSSGKYSNGSSGKKSTRSERAVNTTDLQSCLLRFTNEFDDFYEDEHMFDSNSKQSKASPGVSSSIFRENSKNSDMEVDDGDYDDSDEFPATPTKLGNVSVTNMEDDTPSRKLNNAKKGFMASLLSSSKPKLSHIDTREDHSPGNRKSKKNSLGTPKTPSEPTFMNSSVDSYNNTSLMLSSNNTTAASDITFSFLQQQQHQQPHPSSSSSYFHGGKARFDDDHLTSKFKNVHLVGSGEFSLVYSMEFENVKYAVKRTKHPLSGPKTRLRKLEEVEILKTLQENEINDYEGHEYVLNYINYWEFNSNLYIMTEFCENGSLDKFLIENGKIAKLDEWRVWKILIEIMIGLRFLHSNDILHLDLKPANIFITFDGSLKIGDFGLATKLPIPPYFEREGDREYIAPEVISHQQYEKPADIFSVGLIMVEIAANIILPDNGASWQKLRSGDLTDAGKLSSTDLASYTSSLFNNNNNMSNAASNPSSYSSYSEPVEIFQKSAPTNLLGSIKEIPATAPVFLTDGKGSLDSLVHWMINPNPHSRPSADTVLNTYECQVVESRRKCGSVIYEGEFGPVPDESDLQNEKELLHGGVYPRILYISKTRSSIGSITNTVGLHPGMKLMDSNDTLTKNTIDNMLS